MSAPSISMAAEPDSALEVPVIAGGGEIVDPTFRVDGSKPAPAVDLLELWAYRELLLFMTLRDLRVRYKQTFLGAGWAVAQPLMQMGIMTVVLGYIADLRHRTEIPYAALTFAALVPWQLFSSALVNACTCLVSNERLVTKVYFPRVILPASAVLARVMDFFVCLGVLAVIMGSYIVMGRLPWPGVEVLMLPVFTAWAIVLAFAAGLYLSALNVKWRDVGQLTPFLLQVLVFLSGVYMAAKLVPAKFQFVYHLNPIADIIDGFRWCLFGKFVSDAPPPPMVPSMIALGGTIALLVVGVKYFRKAEETFADVI